jgi:multicomponent K+:H+ antiporter subunit D
MNHLPVLPVLIPLVAGAVLLLMHDAALRLRRLVVAVACLALLGVATLLVALADQGGHLVYQLGNWPSNVGIVLVVDRLSALMVLLTAILGAVAASAAAGGLDARQAHFHALLMFQLMGISGAFLTGDLFNLFVFFEVLLIASYGLLVHAADGERLKRATHYMILNLTGSSLFLVALGVLFGLVGTLNMADLAVKVAATPDENVALVRAAGLLLMVVFALKGALLPLWFWLPRTYAAATPAVAALFAIMTKVGIYAVYRVHTLIFGAEAGPAADVAAPWILPLGLATLALAALGALAAPSLRTLAGYLVVASAGTLFLAFGVGGTDALGAALYYLVHSTLAAAALFLLADLVGRHRPAAGDCLKTDDAIRRRDPLAFAFILAAVSIAALPPLAGFVAKVALLDALAAHPEGAWLWTIVLVSGLFVIVALARAGSHLFWRPPPKGLVATSPVAAPAFAETAPLAALLTASIALSVLADPVLAYARAAAAQLAAPSAYVAAVLGQQPVERPEVER